MSSGRPFSTFLRSLPGIKRRDTTSGDSSQSLLQELVNNREWVTLDESYAINQKLNKRYGTTYYWSTHLLPAVKRPHVHALYGLCRYADDIVDDLGSTATVEERAAVLQRVLWRKRPNRFAAVRPAIARTLRDRSTPQVARQ